MDSESVDKVESLFTYLRELVALRSKSVHDIKDQVWLLDPLSLEDELPGIQVSYRDSYADEPVSSEPLLSVAKPEFNACPNPPEQLKVWLKPGWDSYKNEVSVYEKKEAIGASDGELVAVYFDDDESCIAAFNEWSKIRADWVKKQKLISKARDLFVDLYNIHADLDRDSETLELVVGTGFIQDRETGINHPLFLKGAKIVFDSENNVISIVDNDSTPELYSLLLRDMGDLNLSCIQEAEAEIENEQYHPFDRLQTAQFLKRLVHNLTPKSEFSEEPNAKFTSSDIRLLVTMHSVFFVRKRIDGTAKAIERILEGINEGLEIPQYLIDIVQGGIRQVVNNDEEETIEEKLAAVGGEDIDILLAKEANREQLEIARRIELHNAVLVQGPPGTGKTHTIANLMGHFLSQGKSILVTSHTKKALSVLKEKLPVEMQSLCVSVLDDSNDDMGKSIDAITEYTGNHNSKELKRIAESAEAERNDVIASLSEVRKQIFATLNQENACIVFAGESITPINAAKYINENKALLENIIPGNIVQGAAFPLLNDELDFLYKSNVEITKEEEEALDLGLPEPGQLLAPQDFEDAVEVLTSSQKRILAVCAEGEWSIHPSADNKSLSITTDFGNVNAFIDRPKETNELLEYVRTYEGTEEWRVRAAADGKKGGGYRVRWNALFAQIEKTYQLSQGLVADCLGKNVVIDENFSLKEARDDLGKMRDLYERKGKISKMDRLFNKGLETVESFIHINGHPLQNADECLLVLRLSELELERARCRKYWEDLMSDYGAPAFDELDHDEPERIAYNWIDHIKKLLNWYSTERAKLIKLMEAAGVTPVNTLLQESTLDSEEKDVLRTLNAMEKIIPRICEIALAAFESNEANEKVEASKNTLLESGRTSIPACVSLRNALADLDTDAYSQSYGEYIRIYNKSDLKERRYSLLGKLNNSAPLWAQKIEKREGIYGQEFTPQNVKEAWKYKQYQAFLDELCKTSLSELQNKAFHLSERYRQSTVKLAQYRAWYHLLERTESDITLSQALGGWKLAMKKIGKGTGKRAAEMKKHARAQMAKAQQAVPAWIMPMGKALDSLNPKKNRFDVIIIDEASQSDVSALAVTYLGKKVIIVGDDKQVSPMAVGIEDAKVANLNEMYIKDKIPNAYLYGPTTSLYDIASTTFQPLMLREHFRCVPQIIGYSNMLSYDFKIKPLREPHSSKLLPAVVSHRVCGGARNGKSKTNHAEAEEIVALIMACMKQPEYNGKTFGVISLLGGGQQVKLIQQILFNKMEVKDIESRRILVGESASFQGDERDVIFLSLVDSNEGEGPLNLMGSGQNDAAKKRYNVAASRAKDQLWVVHSLDAANDLKGGDIRRGLIEYAQDPLAFAEKIKEVETKAESPFEAAVGKALVSKGYRIVQQWEVGSYRIDMVAIGKLRRVAIECDGEEWHSGEDKIREDMERQAILERIGWRFIRIRGSEYYRSPDETIDRVCEELTELEVEPLGNEASEIQTEDKPDLLQRVLADLNTLREVVSDDKPTIEDKAATVAAALDTKWVEGKPYAQITEEDAYQQLESEKKPVIATPAQKQVSEKQVSTEFDIGESKVQQKASVTPLEESIASPSDNSFSSATKPSAPIDSLTESIANKGLEFVDKRSSGGTLWIIGNRNITFKVNDIAREHGTRFNFAEKGGRSTQHRPAWYMVETPKNYQKLNQFQDQDTSKQNVGNPRAKAGIKSVKAKKKRRAAFVRTKLNSRDIGGFSSYMDKSYRAEIKKRMEDVLKIEAPVEKKRLFNTVRASLGVGRSGIDIQSHNDYILKLVEHRKTEFLDSQFIWRKDQDPGKYDEYRYNNGENYRSVNEIPYEEILSAIRDILDRNISMTHKAFIEKLASSFGFKRVAKRIKQTFDDALDLSVKNGAVTKSESGVYMLSKK